ncbi:DUF2103 domain-containing protein [Desulfosporosinus sp. SB140]|uniref:DUF2103 domain-containing protein n=1 Tax=Desulfosporosinus paludis TaxID=3115649 RepID=UPI00388F5B70
MKYRKNKVKREHGIIRNALDWLEQLSCLAEVTDIIPGVIDVNHSPERGIVYKYKTKTGCKLLLKSNGSIQEVFVVTKNPSVVQAWVSKEFPYESSEANLKTEPPKRMEISKKKLSKTSVRTEKRFGHVHSHESQKGVSKKRSKMMTLKPFLENVEPEATKIADVLDRTTFKKLSLLKQSLKSYNKKPKSNY